MLSTVGYVDFASLRLVDKRWHYISQSGFVEFFGFFFDLSVLDCVWIYLSSRRSLLLKFNSTVLGHLFVFHAQLCRLRIVDHLIVVLKVLPVELIDLILVCLILAQNLKYVLSAVQVCIHRHNQVIDKTLCLQIRLIIVINDLLQYSHCVLDRLIADFIFVQHSFYFLQCNVQIARICHLDQLPQSKVEYAACLAQLDKQFAESTVLGVQQLSV